MSLQGTLKTLGITEVLEFLSARDASCRLDVTTEMGTASFAMHEGGVATAEYSFIRESGMDAAEATYYVVSELDGTFFFDEDHAPSDVDETEDIGSVLSRTAHIAENWTEVEEVIASPNHLLIRNNQLDGSVTIQPEWWKALEVIGDGRTSLELAAELELGALDASLTALAMTRAGLLMVREIDPMEIDVDTSLGVVDEEVADPGISDDVDIASDYVDMPAVETTDEYVLDPVEMLEMVEVQEPLPPAEYSFSDREPEVEPEIEPIEAPQLVDEVFEGPSGMDDLSELEYVVEHDEFERSVAPVAETAPLPAAEPAPLTPIAEAVGGDDDGWSTAHRPSESELQPLTATAPVPAPAPVVEPVPAPVAEPVPAPVEAAVAPVPATEPPAPPMEAPAPEAQPEQHSPFDVIGVPGAESAVLETPPLPVPDVPDLSLADLPEPPPPLAEDAFASVPPAAPVPEPFAPAPPAVDAPADATAMAGEVLDDLAALSDQLDDTESNDQNWTLDGTFVPEAQPSQPDVAGDPFGDLGELLNDSADDDERGSVLKFLRRD